MNKTSAHDFFAMKEILLGEEITFDYAVGNYSIDYFDRPCQCDVKSCHGHITGWKD